MKYTEQVRFKWYHHLIFWAAYILFWSSRDLIHHPDLLDNIQLNLISSSLYAVMVYLNVYLLVPRFLLSRKYLTYLFVLLAILSCTAFIASWAISSYLMHKDAADVADFFSSTRGVMVLHFEALFVMLITLAIVLVKVYVVQDNQTQELIKKNLESELNFLKNQINPHFLFNSLNSIYFLIPKNPKKAAEILLKFSDMLSHQLYEGTKDFIPLENEIKHLEDYMELERVRQGERVNINWSVEGTVNGQQVAPMIFLTFLENAFKHGQQATDSIYNIDGKLSVSPNQVHFKLKNDMPEISNGSEQAGVGLENTKRRLALLYPTQHELEIDQSNGIFSVELTLKTS